MFLAFTLYVSKCARVCVLILFLKLDRPADVVRFSVHPHEQDCVAFVFFVFLFFFNAFTQHLERVLSQQCDGKVGQSCPLQA